MNRRRDAFDFSLMIAVGCLLALLLFAWWVPPASGADDVYGFTPQPGPYAKCVTGAEVGRIDGHRDQIERLLDGPGMASPFNSNARDYRPCGLSWDRGRVTVLYWPGGMIRAVARAKWVTGDLELPHAHPRYSPSTTVERYSPFGGLW